MARPETARRLIVNADDFGRSTGINQAVIQAHREGILTTASLMVNEPGLAEAVELARENPRLGVGLHLALSHGRSALPPEKIPGLVNARGEFSNRAEATGLRYFLRREVAWPIARGNPRAVRKIPRHRPDARPRQRPSPLSPAPDDLQACHGSGGQIWRPAHAVDARSILAERAARERALAVSRERTRLFIAACRGARGVS